MGQKETKQEHPKHKIVIEVYDRRSSFYVMKEMSKNWEPLDHTFDNFDTKLKSKRIEMKIPD